MNGPMIIMMVPGAAVSIQAHAALPVQVFMGSRPALPCSLLVVSECQAIIQSVPARRRQCRVASDPPSFAAQHVTITGPQIRRGAV